MKNLLKLGPEFDFEVRYTAGNMTLPNCNKETVNPFIAPLKTPSFIISVKV